MTRRKAIGENPLDSIVPVRAVETTAESEIAEADFRRDERWQTTRSGIEPHEHATGGRKTRLTVQVPERLVEEARDAVMFLHTCGVHTTLAGLVQGAIAKELAELRGRHNDGAAFPSRESALPAGRPIGP